MNCKPTPKKSIMLRTNETERINTVKEEFFKIEGIPLTTEGIFNKGLDAIDSYLSEKKINQIDINELNFMQRKIIEGAIQQNVDIELVKIMANKEFKVSQMSILLDAAMEKGIDLVKFRIMANPKLNSHQMLKLVEMDGQIKLDFEDFEILANPEWSSKQIMVLSKYMDRDEFKENKDFRTDNKMSPEVLEARANFFEKLKEYFEAEEKRKKIKGGN